MALTNPILLSTNNLIMSSIAKGRQEKTRYLYAAKRYMLYSAAVVTFYFAVLLVGGSHVMALFYGRHTEYLSEAPLLPMFVLAYGLEFVSMYAGALLAGMEQTRALFLQQLWGTLISVMLVLPLVYRYGLQAAIGGLVLTNGIKALSGWYMVYSGLRARRKINDENLLVAQP